MADTRGPKKPENFTTEQIEAIRNALRDWRKRHPEKGGKLKSQQQMADVFSNDDATIGQQTMGGYLRTNERVGMTQRTAQAIVTKLGYENVYHFFEAHGLEGGTRKRTASGNPELDEAVRHARALDVDEDVIEYVSRQVLSGHFKARRAKFILSEMLALERYKLEEREGAPPPQVTPIITTDPPPKPRKPK